MPQFFISKSVTKNAVVQISGKDAHHIINVLRLKESDWLILSDGKGKSYKARIKSLRPKLVEAQILNEIEHHFASPSPHLAFAVIKHDRTEYIMQKAVELGCANILPFFSSRTIPKYKNNIGARKLMRWQKIAMEAAKQSGLTVKPEVNSPLSFEELCHSFGKYDKVLLFWEGENEKDLRSQVSDLKAQTLIVIGPEGGFSQEEISAAKKNGAVTVSLGTQILRVETAALITLGITQYELGNLSLK